MKTVFSKVLIAIGLVLMAFSMFFPLLALAESTGTTPSQPFDWAQMATIPGAITVTLFIVQALKLPLDRVFGKVPTRIVVFAISFLVFLGGKLAMGELSTPPDYILATINSLIVFVGAMGLYEVTFAKINK